MPTLEYRPAGDICPKAEPPYATTLLQKSF